MGGHTPKHSKRKNMKRIFLLLLVAFTMGSTLTLSARDKKEDKNERPDRKEAGTRQATRMATELKLSDELQKWFIPLYAEYQDTLRSVRRPAGKPDGEKADKQKADKDSKDSERGKLTDEQATKRIEETFAQEEQELQLKRAYYARFKEKLTPQQMLTIFCRPAMNANRGPQQGGRPGGQMRQGGQGGFGGGMPQGGFGGGFGGDF